MRPRWVLRPCGGSGVGGGSGGGGGWRGLVCSLRCRLVRGVLRYCELLDRFAGGLAGRFHHRGAAPGCGERARDRPERRRTNNGATTQRSRAGSSRHRRRSSRRRRRRSRRGGICATVLALGVGLRAAAGPRRLVLAWELRWRVHLAAHHGRVAPWRGFSLRLGAKNAKKTPSWSHLYAKNDRFTRTGSGQT